MKTVLFLLMSALIVGLAVFVLRSKPELPEALIKKHIPEIRKVISPTAPVQAKPKDEQPVPPDPEIGRRIDRIMEKSVMTIFELNKPLAAVPGPLESANSAPLVKKAPAPLEPSTKDRKTNALNAAETPPQPNPTNALVVAEAPMSRLWNKLERNQSLISK